MSNYQKDLLPIRSFADCERVIITARNPNKGKPLGKNARLIPLAKGDYALRYYYTNVVTWHRDGTFTLDNGTW